jgi:hypothetical protein
MVQTMNGNPAKNDSDYGYNIHRYFISELIA